MSIKQDKKQTFRQNQPRKFDEEYFAHIQKELEQLSIQHLQVLETASDEDESEVCSTQCSPLKSQPLSTRISKRKRKKKPINPILISAKYRDMFIDVEQTNNQNDLTYVDCLIFDEERRKRRSNKNITERIKEVDPLLPPVREQEELRLPKVDKEFNRYSNEGNEYEEKSPDSALGSEAGSSNDPQLCECGRIADAFTDKKKMTSWKEIKEQGIPSYQRSIKKHNFLDIPRSDISPMLRLIDFRQLAKHRNEGIHFPCCHQNVFNISKNGFVEFDADDILTPICSLSESETESENTYSHVADF